MSILHEIIWRLSQATGPSTTPTSRASASDLPIRSYVEGILLWAVLLLPGLFVVWQQRRRDQAIHALGGISSVTLTPAGWAPLRCRLRGDAMSLWFGGGVMIWCFILVPAIAQTAFAVWRGQTNADADSNAVDASQVGVLAITYIIGLAVVFGVHSLLPGRLPRLVLRLGLRFRQEDLGRLIVTAVLAVSIAIPLTNLAATVSTLAWQVFQLHRESAHALLQLMGRSESSPWILIGAMVNAAVLAPVFEEILFRGHLQTALTNLFRSRWPAIVITSILFAAVHIEFWMMPPIFVLSLAIGYFYERTGNLWVAIAIHVSFNTLSTALFLLTHG